MQVAQIIIKKRIFLIMKKILAVPLFYKSFSYLASYIEEEVKKFPIAF